MPSSYNVKVWNNQRRKHRSGNYTYRARWTVDGKEFNEPFRTSGLADGFRSDLVTATRKGEPFDTESGLPQSMVKESALAVSTFALACDYADMMWPNASPKYRKSIAGSLTKLTMGASKRSLPKDPTFRRTLTSVFNAKMRLEADLDDEMDIVSKLRAAGYSDAAVKCGAEAELCSRRASEFAKPEVLRAVLNGFERNLDGSKAAADTVRIRRAAFRGFLDYAVERGVLDSNPLEEVKVKKRTYELKEVDPAAVVNPMQGRMLLAAVAERDPELEAFFGTMYFAALRPEEAANLNKRNLSIPEEGAGWLILDSARPEIDAVWTDSGEASEAGPLKHRNVGSSRSVPCTPQLTALLHKHIALYGTAPDGRLFRGSRNGGRISSTVYGRAWAAARSSVFTPEVQARPIAKRPYDLRHAAVSTWLSSNVEATKVAKWAGHSLGVLMRVYAKCLDGGDQAAMDRIERGYMSY
ncbi:integrase [Amycolatopsis sp. La24]|uniref:tyrosine-type recombinase/integrase n=1 Tax=Amycolatopsis sp. La24 TaxID=3028304 RepID=UPI0023AFF317|nr:integrase [Amycolatopsis sp. La24]